MTATGRTNVYNCLGRVGAIPSKMPHILQTHSPRLKKELPILLRTNDEAVGRSLVHSYILVRKE